MLLRGLDMEIAHPSMLSGNRQGFAFGMCITGLGIVSAYTMLWCDVPNRKKYLPWAEGTSVCCFGFVLLAFLAAVINP